MCVCVYVCVVFFLFVLLFGCISRIVFNYECEWFTHILVVVALVVVAVVVVVHVAAAVGLCQGCALFFSGPKVQDQLQLQQPQQQHVKRSDDE